MSNKKGDMRQKHPGMMQNKEPVEVVNRLTREQMLDLRITEIEAAVENNTNLINDIRNLVLEIKKELIKINKSK